MQSVIHTSPAMSSAQAATKMQKKPDIQADIPYMQEIFRKGIHLSSLSIPIIYAFIERWLALSLLGCLLALALILDVGRYYVPAIRQFILNNFGSMMRQHELDDQRKLLSGATYVLLSAFLCVLVYPKIIAVTAFAVMIVSDICSALIGRKFGTMRFADKSLQGTVAFWVSACCVVWAIALWTGAPWQYQLIACGASLVGGVVEAASIRLRMDDNFSIPLSVGMVLWGGILLLDASVQAAILQLLG